MKNLCTLHHVRIYYSYQIRYVCIIDIKLNLPTVTRDQLIFMIYLLISNSKKKKNESIISSLKN